MISQFAFAVLSLVWFASAAGAAEGSPVIVWGNTRYVDLDVGQAHEFLGKQVRLESVKNNSCTVSVDGVTASLRVARIDRPTVVGGVRVFVADNRPVADLTTQKDFPLTHSALSRDALLCLSDPGEALLDAERFTFPISREDGFRWTCDEDSGMFAYLQPDRSHEGIDLNLHEARGRTLHALVAVEDAVVRWVEHGAPNEACVLLESAAHPGLFYVYQHLFRERVYVKAGQRVTRGHTLGHIWGDWRWGHLHFAVVASGQPPTFEQRYQKVLNCFPQLYELWHGTLDAVAPPVTSGDFRFAAEYWRNGNRSRQHAFSETIGYGWQLGEWCTAGKVEKSFVERNRPGESALLRKVMHAETHLPATNPNDWFDFEVSVPNGTYTVKAEVGDAYTATWQRVLFEEVDAGVFDLSSGELRWTPQREVPVRDGRLTVRLQLKAAEVPAAIRELFFDLVEVE